MRESIVSVLFGLFLSLSAFAESDQCILSAEEHIDQNMGYAVGNDCKSVTIIGAPTTRLKFVNGAKGECRRISANNQSTIVFSMDASKEDAYMGNGCQVRATYKGGNSRIISVSAVEN